jgi:hypothetical protein
MLKDEVRASIAAINYWAWYEDTLDGAMNRVLGEYIYDTLSKVSPIERAAQIREALASDEKLSRIGIPMSPRWSEEENRALLNQLVDRIEFYEPGGPPRFQDINKLTDRLEKLRPLVQPLAETSTLSDAIKTFEKKVLPNLGGYNAHMDTRQLLRHVLWFDTSKILSEFFTPEVTDSMFREYLRNIAWKIEDAGRP